MNIPNYPSYPLYKDQYDRERVHPGYGQTNSLISDSERLIKLEIKINHILELLQTNEKKKIKKK